MLIRQTLLARDWETLRKGEKEGEEIGRAGERVRRARVRARERLGAEAKAGECEGTLMTVGQGC